MENTSVPVLYVVATPIGNLEDLSFRALRILREVDVVAAEDTRRTLKLLTHYEIRKPLVSLREHNEARESARLCARMLSGQQVALVSDAGTPGIADPGARLVRAAREAGIRVVPIPGPSAIIAALSVSGFPADEFVFLGFPPRGGSAREAWLTRLAVEPRVAVFFESPHFIRRTAADVGLTVAERQILVFSELTKIHEKLVIRPAFETADAIAERGEFVVVVGPKTVETPAEEREDVRNDVIALFESLTTARQDDSQAIQLIGKALGLVDPAVRKIIKKHKILVNRYTRSVP